MRAWVGLSPPHPSSPHYPDPAPPLHTSQPAHTCAFTTLPSSRPSSPCRPPHTHLPPSTPAGPRPPTHAPVHGPRPVLQRLIRAATHHADRGVEGDGQAWLGQVLLLLRPLSQHVLDMGGVAAGQEGLERCALRLCPNLPWTCPGPCPEPCPRPALDLPWTCPGPALDLPWTCPGPALDLPWTYPGPALDLPWTYPGPAL